MGREYEDLDRILDRALASYSSADPLDGLEERVLQRLALDSARSRWKWAAVAALATAAALAVTLAVVPRARPPKVAELAAPRSANPFPAPAPTPPMPAQRTLHRPRSARPHPFPALTAAERAMVAFTRQHPEDVRDAAEWRENAFPLEIVIPPIEIAPLENESGQ